MTSPGRKTILLPVRAVTDIGYDVRTSTSECHAQIHQQRPARGTSFRRLARHLLQRVVDEVRLLHRGAQRSQCATKCTQPMAPRIRPEDRHDQHGAGIFAQQSPTRARHGAFWG